MQVSWCAVSGLLDHLLLPRVEYTVVTHRRGVGHIRGCEECAHCDGTNEYTLPAHRGEDCPMHLNYCHLTACSDTQCNICTQRLQLHVCVGCNMRLTVNNQPTNHITLTCGSSPQSLQTRQGVCCRGTQRMHKRCKH